MEANKCPKCGETGSPYEVTTIGELGETASTVSLITGILLILIAGLLLVSLVWSLFEGILDDNLYQLREYGIGDFLGGFITFELDDPGIYVVLGLLGVSIPFLYYGLSLIINFLRPKIKTFEYRCAICSHEWQHKESKQVPREESGEQEQPIPTALSTRQPTGATEVKHEDIESLIQTLRSKQFLSDRAGAAKALGEIGDPRAIEPLMEALRDKGDRVVQVEAARALGKMGPHAVEPLLEALNEDLGPIGIVPALGQIGGPKVIELLLEMLETKPSLSVIAALTLWRMGEHRPRAVETIIEVLETSEDDGQRHQAVTALSEIGDPRAMESLTRATKDSSFLVRRAAKGALRQIKAGSST